MAQHLTWRLETWRVALTEMRKLGIEAKIEITGGGIAVRADDGLRHVEYHCSTLAAGFDPEDRILAQLMLAVDDLLAHPKLTVIEGGKS